MIAANPLEWHGWAFLGLYIALFIVALAGARATAGWLRPEGRLTHVSDEDELAMLSGGLSRLAETVLARLYARGALTVGSDGVRFHADHAGSSEAERDVLRLPSPSRWKTVRAALSGEGARIEDRLAGCWLIMPHGEARRLGIFEAVPFALLLGLGVARLTVDGSDGTGPLLAALGATALAGTYRLVVIDRRTRAGILAVREARQRFERLSRAPTKAETGTAVALFGTTVLLGSSMADLHHVRREKGNSGGGCGSGDSGCGGGGCGGCGG